MCSEYPRHTAHGGGWTCIEHPLLPLQLRPTVVVDRPRRRTLVLQSRRVSLQHIVGAEVHHSHPLPPAHFRHHAWCLGIDLGYEEMSPSGRPFKLADRGEARKELFA